MPELPVSPQLLDDLIEGRLAYASPASEASQLVRLARQCAALRIPGPGPAAESRMRSRFSAAMDEHRRRPMGFLAIAGLPAMPALRHRLAAAALTVAVAGGAMSYTTGIGPVDAIEGALNLARSIVANLTPGGGDPGPEPGAPTTTATTEPNATRTPTPRASGAEPAATAGASPTATPRPASVPGNDANAGPAATSPGSPPAVVTSTPVPAASTPDDARDDDGTPGPGQTPTPDDSIQPDDLPTPTPIVTTTPSPSSTPSPTPASKPDDGGDKPEDKHDDDDGEPRGRREPDDDEEHH